MLITFMYLFITESSEAHVAKCIIMQPKAPILLSSSIDHYCILDIFKELAVGTLPGYRMGRVQDQD